MFLDINPVRMERISGNEKDSFCLEDSIATFAHWIGRDYELMFINSWGFNYASPDKMNPLLIGERIFLHNTDIMRQNFLQSLEFYHGIKLTWIDSWSIQEDLLNIQLELTANRPVVLDFDIFWAPWARGFQKSHQSHSYLINGVDDPNAAFLCMDSFSLISYLTLPFRNFIKGRTNLGRFTIFNEPIINPDDIISSINMTAANLLGGEKTVNYFNLMREFGDEIIQSFDVQREMGGQTEYHNTILWNKIKEFALTRLRFALLLKYLSKKLSSRESFLVEMSLRFKESGLMWYKIMNMLGKIFLVINLKTDIIRRFANSIKEIADFEEKLAYMLLKH
jgi:hypothetical protein